MKIAIASDLHLEFAPLHIENLGIAEVLILAGDICTAVEFTRSNDSATATQYRTFFDNVCSEFKHVIYVLGNHEHYSYDIAFTLDTLKHTLNYDNLHILENDFLDIDGIRFVGATLWTDYNRECPVTIEQCKFKMHDYEVIKNSAKPVSYKVYPKDGSTKFKEKPSKFCPEQALEFHKKSKAYIDIVTQDFENCVIISHHSPTFYNVSEEFSWDYYGNGAYCSNMDDFIMDRPQFKSWISGHIHSVNDYLMGNTRMVCNPRGYKGYEQRAVEFELKHIDIN